MFILLLTLASAAFCLEDNNIPLTIPEYVLKYAPLIYLHSEDTYLPSDISSHLLNTFPTVNSSSGQVPVKLDEFDFSKVPQARTEYDDEVLMSDSLGGFDVLNLDNLDSLNNFGKNGSNVFLTAKKDVSRDPSWLKGLIPDAKGSVNGKTSVIIVAEKAGDITDAFYFGFWAFNQGPWVNAIAQNLGDHIGDWEHIMIRFKDKQPQTIWLSQHDSGQAFDYQVLADRFNSDMRPVAFSANGSHAFYATEGPHDYTVAQNHSSGQNIVIDHCNTGRLYDPILSAYWYKWTNDSTELGQFLPYNSSHPTGFLYFRGHWGDSQYVRSDRRQVSLLDRFFKYVDGPEGPAFKSLGRKDVGSGVNSRKIWDHLVP